MDHTAPRVCPGAGEGWKLLACVVGFTVCASVAAAGFCALVAWWWNRG